MASIFLVEQSFLKVHGEAGRSAGSVGEEMLENINLSDEVVMW